MIGPSGCKPTFLVIDERLSLRHNSRPLDEQDIYSVKFNLNQLRKRVGDGFQQPNFLLCLSMITRMVQGHGIRRQKTIRCLSEKS